jgi:hypothetical protein
MSHIASSTAAISPAVMCSPSLLRRDTIPAVAPIPPAPDSAIPPLQPGYRDRMEYRGRSDPLAVVAILPSVLDRPVPGAIDAGGTVHPISPSLKHVAYFMAFRARQR